MASSSVPQSSCPPDPSPSTASLSSSAAPQPPSTGPPTTDLPAAPTTTATATAESSRRARRRRRANNRAAADPAVDPAVVKDEQPAEDDPAKPGRPQHLHLVVIKIMRKYIPEYQENRDKNVNVTKLNAAVNLKITKEVGPVVNWQPKYMYTRLPPAVPGGVGPVNNFLPFAPVVLSDLTESERLLIQAAREKYLACPIVRHAISSRMGSMCRGELSETKREMKTQLKVMTAAAGDPEQAMGFWPWITQHEVVGWDAQLKTQWITVKGTLPKGDLAVSQRNQFSHDWYDAQPKAVQAELKEEYDEYCIAINSVRDALLDVGKADEPNPGKSLTIAERGIAFRGLAPIVKSFNDGYHRSTDLSLFTLIAGHARPDHVETMRMHGIGTDHGRGSDAFLRFAPHVVKALYQAYMAFLAAEAALAEHGTPIPKFEDAIKAYKASLALRHDSEGPESPTGSPTGSPSTPTASTSAKLLDVTMNSPSPAPPAAARRSASSTTPPATARRSAPAKRTPLFLPDTDADEAPPSYESSTPTTPSHAAVLLAKSKGRKGRPVNAIVPSTPTHQPAVSSPLRTGWSLDEEDDELPVPRLVLPTPPGHRKAYANGSPRELLGSIPANSGVLDVSGDLFSSGTGTVPSSPATPAAASTLAITNVQTRVIGKDKRLNVRLPPTCDVHISGEDLEMGDDGESASATGPSSRSIVVIPGKGYASATWVTPGQGHMVIARALPPSAASTSTPVPAIDPAEAYDEESTPTTPTLPPRIKRKRNSAGTAGAVSTRGDNEAPSTPAGSEDPAGDGPGAGSPRQEEVPPPSAPSSPPTTRPSKRPRPDTTAQLGNKAVSAPLPAPRSTSSQLRRTRDAPTRGTSSASAAPLARVPKSRKKQDAAGSPITEQTFIEANVTRTGLSDTALGDHVDILFTHAATFGREFIEVLSHLIVLNRHEDVPVAQQSSKTGYSHKASTTVRPPQVAAFAKFHRKLTRGVFSGFNRGTYQNRFWEWWGVLTAEVCAPVSQGRPGKPIEDADFTSLLWAGKNGFDVVVTGLALWMLGLMQSNLKAARVTFDRQPTPVEMKEWLAAVQSVEAVAGAMVASLA